MPARENSIRSEFESVVTVPTEEREVGEERRCSRETAGGSPSISPTFGAPTWWISRLAYGATDSR